jgi:hypothetical protein
VLYNLTDQQRDALLQIVRAASIPGAAAPMVASIMAALERGVEPDADTAERAGVQQTDGAAVAATGADANGDDDTDTA